MIVVFDSNVWVSALRFGGIPLVALRTAYVRHTIASCAEIEAEAVRILQAKFDFEARTTARIIQGYLDRGLRVSITGSLKNVCRDENDDMVVECALVAKAGIIVSGDKDLLSLGSYVGIVVLRPAAFLANEEPI